MPITNRKTIRRLWNLGNVLANKLFKGEGSITDVVDLHSVLLELQQCKGPNNEDFFNLLIKKIQPNVEAYNELLQMSQMSQIRFDFKLFAGPEAVLAAKVAKAVKEAEAIADFVAKTEEVCALLNHQREHGFTASDLIRFPKEINMTMFLFLTTNGPDAKEPSFIETCLGIQCENRHRYGEINDCIRTSVNKQDKDFELCTQNVFHCMIFTKCNNCTVLAACIHVIRPTPSQLLKESIVCYVMRNVHSQFRSLLMVIYLRSFLKDSYPILPRFLDAIENPDSSYRNELVTSLRRYPNCRSSSEEIDPSQYQTWVKFWTESKHSLIKSL